MLQKGGEEQVDLFLCRQLFDGLIRDLGGKYPAFKRYLTSFSNIVNNPDFENGIIKLQSGKEEDLTVSECAALEIFLIDKTGQTFDPRNVDSQGEEEKLDYAETIRRNAVKSNKRKSNKSLYRSVAHCISTSNVCERLFSLAKLLMCSLRKSMSPSTLNMRLFLKANRNLWPSAFIIQDILDSRSDADGDDDDLDDIPDSDDDVNDDDDGDDSDNDSI